MTTVPGAGSAGFNRAARHWTYQGLAVILPRMGTVTFSLRRRARSAWGFFIDTIDWTSNGDRRRPKFAERSTIYDPTAGSGPPDPTIRESLDAERRGTGED